MADDDDPLDRANRARSTHGPRVAELMRRRSQLTPEEAALFVEVFPSVVDEHYDDLMRYLRRHLEDADASDVAQNTVITFYENVLAEGFPERVGGYLFAIADGKRKNLGHVRRREPFSVGLPSSGSEPPRTPADLAAALDAAEATRRFLPQLSEEHRRVVSLVLLDGLELQEAADALKLPVGTVKSRLTAAKRRLRELARPMFPDRGPEER